MDSAADVYLKSMDTSEQSGPIIEEIEDVVETDAEFVDYVKDRVRGLIESLHRILAELEDIHLKI